MRPLSALLLVVLVATAARAVSGASLLERLTSLLGIQKADKGAPLVVELTGEPEADAKAGGASEEQPAEDAQVCTAADYADGTCGEAGDSAPPAETDDSDDDEEEDEGPVGTQPDPVKADDSGEYEADDSGDDEEEDSDDEWDEEEFEVDAECVDKDPQCETYKKEGACAENPGYMTHYCPISCDTCEAVWEAAKAAEFATKGDFNGPCVDTDYRCLDWAGQGECDANPGYMRKYCRNACMVCSEGTNQFGIGQRLPGTDEAKPEEIEKTKEWIEKSSAYMARVWKDEEFGRVRHKCKNQHQDCTFWAALGECEANPNYMVTNCAPACGSCDKLDIRHRCPIEPDNKCIWEPGDLNTLMETIVDDADGSGDYKKYNPIALSRPKLKRDGTPSPGLGEGTNSGPWVVLLENFVSAEEADRLVELGQQKGYERSSDVGKEKPDGTHDSLVSESRTSHNTWCQEKSCYLDPMVVPVIDRIANVTKTEVQNSEYLQLLQYEPGQYYKQHHDYIPHHKDMPCGVRILTLFIYLNDVEGGGGTHFPKLDITVMPKKGSALLWPSVRDEAPESKDGRTDHEALPVTKGIKYGANAWIHSRNFKAAYAKNCH